MFLTGVFGIAFVFTAIFLLMAARSNKALHKEAEGMKKLALDYQQQYYTAQDQADTWRHRYELLQNEMDGDLDGDGVPDKDMEYVRKSILGDNYKESE